MEKPQPNDKALNLVLVPAGWLEWCRLMLEQENYLLFTSPLHVAACWVFAVSSRPVGSLQAKQDEEIPMVWEGICSVLCLLQVAAKWLLPRSQ